MAEKIALQEAMLGEDEPRLRDLIAAMAHFMVDAEGQWMEHKAAKRELLAMDDEQMAGLNKTFGKALEDDASPPASGAD